MKPVENPARVVDTESLLRQLNWRYATKQFDPSRKIPAADWAALEQALVLTPSSFGLQPWKFIVVTDQPVKEKLVAASWGQRQLADASHVVVFAIKKEMGAAEVKRYVDRIAEVRGVSADSLEGYRKMMADSLAGPIKAAGVDGWSARQTYIALGGFLTAAAVLGIDACPMEGFEPAQYDQILGLGKKGYAAVVVATAGYRAAGDTYAGAPKVRFKVEEVVERV